jgi:protein TonB
MYVQIDSRGDGQRRWQRGVAASLGLHVVLLTGLAMHRRPLVAAITPPGDANGHLTAVTFNPGAGAPTAALRTSKAAPTPAVSHALSAPVPRPEALSTVADATSATGSGGSDALGQGELKLALMVNHPYPSPNLSPLPSGTTGDVIVDIVIDANGAVAKYSLVKGLGHGVDDTVLATVQKWTFKPATRNGIAVASEQELLFHYEKV